MAYITLADLGYMGEGEKTTAYVQPSYVGPTGYDPSGTKTTYSSGTIATSGSDTAQIPSGPTGAEIFAGIFGGLVTAAGSIGSTYMEIEAQKDIAKMEQRARERLAAQQQQQIAQQIALMQARAAAGIASPRPGLPGWVLPVVGLVAVGGLGIIAVVLIRK